MIPSTKPIFEYVYLLIHQIEHIFIILANIEETTTKQRDNTLTNNSWSILYHNIKDFFVFKINKRKNNIYLFIYKKTKFKEIIIYEFVSMNRFSFQFICIKFDISLSNKFLFCCFQSNEMRKPSIQMPKFLIQNLIMIQEFK